MLCFILSSSWNKMSKQDVRVPAGARPQPQGTSLMEQSNLVEVSSHSKNKIQYLENQVSFNILF